MRVLIVRPNRSANPFGETNNLNLNDERNHSTRPMPVPTNPLNDILHGAALPGDNTRASQCPPPGSALQLKNMPKLQLKRIKIPLEYALRERPRPFTYRFISMDESTNSSYPITSVTDAPLWARTATTGSWETNSHIKQTTMQSLLHISRH